MTYLASTSPWWLDRVDDDIRLVVFAGEFGAELNVGAFLLEVHRFADIVEQASPFG
jgi:hypothetical protein